MRQFTMDRSTDTLLDLGAPVAAPTELLEGPHDSHSMMDTSIIMVDSSQFGGHSAMLTACSMENVLNASDDDSCSEIVSVWNQDLAAIRKLLESEAGGTSCPSCEMPFDKGKKRKLIDSCGHERCYSCMFRNEGCPLCASGENPGCKSGTLGGSTRKLQACSSLNPLSGGSYLPPLGSSDRSPSRPHVKTNGHFTSYMQSRQDVPPTTAIAPEKMAPPSRLPKTRTRPPVVPTSHQQAPFLGADNAVSNMTNSCPTPPQGRRRFFPLRSPFAQRSAKISIDNNSAMSDDEGGNIKPVALDKKCGKEDMYMRLGLLLGEGRRLRSGSNALAGGANMIGGVARQPSRPHTRSSHESCSSLTSYETHTMTSNNTSPVSTLTGSSEADVHAVVSGTAGNRLKDTSDSIGSLMSMSGHSNNSTGSASPLSRRHSVTTTQPGHVEDLNLFKNRRTSIRRSARAGNVKGPIDPKIRFAQYRAQQLTLKPLFFEVPLQEPDPLFLGRHWLIRDIEEALSSNVQGVIVTGNPGTGKTALVLQMVEYSCFGRRRDPSYRQQNEIQSQGIYCQINLVSERIRHLSSQVVAYHFCQADNNSTCLVPDFIHSLAAQLCQAPQLSAYRELLLSEHNLQTSVSMKECIVDPHQALMRGILEPLASLRRVGKIENKNCVIIVDALCESEYHRPDNGDTITSFLAKHMSDFPAWLKVVATVRTQLQDFTKSLPYTRIHLDKLSSNDNLHKDILDYITFRLQNSPSIQSNVTATSGKTDSGNTSQYRFSQHLLTLSQGSFLFAKLTLDLIERGHLVAKSTSYKVLPVSLAQIFLLHFNLRFPTVKSFEKVSHILSVCLSALYPLTLLEIYYSLNSLLVDQFLPWEEFLQRFKLLSGFLVKRLDNTYMFFHPSFREWLMRRDDNESTKFLCDLRAGHSGIAFRLSRVQIPLDPEKTLELGHHILKAHVYRNMALPTLTSRDLQAYWVASSSENVSAALCTMRNIYNPNVKVSRLLLLSGASPNYITELLGNAPMLCMYAHEGIVPMVSLLLEFGADVNLTNSQGCTALSLSASRGHCDVVRQLVAAGSNLGYPDTSGQCALVHAARNGCLNVVGYLLACDWIVKNLETDVELAEAAQQSLVAAASQGHTEIVEYLLDMSEVNADKADTLTGETALTVAAANGCVQVVTTLIMRGATIDATNRKGSTALHGAVKEGHWAATERLLQSHASLEKCDSVGKTPLMLAASEGHMGLIELLLDKGASTRATDREGLTALCWACLRGRVQVAQCLLDRGDEVNHADNTGRTPLDLAAFQGNPTIVQALLERGAAVEHVDLHGMRPLDRAIGCRNLQAVQCFLRKGAKLGPATWAMAAGKPEIMLNLLNKLLEDGNVLYRKNRLQEAAHRYQYALRKIPNASEVPEHAPTFTQLKVNLLLNQSRCKRKMNESEEAIELATEALNLRSDSYEAYYARAKARLLSGQYDVALSDVTQALQCGPHSADINRVLLRLQHDAQARINGDDMTYGAASSGHILNHRVTVHRELNIDDLDV